MTHRYFVETPISGDHATLTASESHHLLHVMRAQPGEEVTLFDGSGAEYVARVESTGRAAVGLGIVSRSVVDRELEIDVTLGVALPKGERQRWLVEKATELGVRCVVPLNTDRGVAQPNPSAIGRLQRTVVEASKQCGRNRLMEVVAAQDWSEFVTTHGCLATAEPSGGCFVAHPGSGNLPAAALIAGAEAGQAVYLAVGPEGGFTAEEISLANEQGWQAIDLGPRILRVETAALALVTLVAL